MMSALLIRLFAAMLLGLTFSQSVEFTQQYLQRLGGAADELRAVVARFDEGARSFALTRQEALERLRGNADTLVVRQGADAETTIARFEAVERRYRALIEAAPLSRPFIAASDPDWPIARRTGEDYRPALPVSLEGLLLTLAGFGLGWAGGACCHGAVRMRQRSRARRMAGG
ncbi:DUF2937 family protein [Aurantimonas sp. HBX-1]|uniref:DUF2937 family protein n=1 Tax=Aurantimonas sp. HBX-1 TaxID=2906072 RepID=UPI001F16AF7D|nr:DUF2937 family protein [Aurantimonas sp. HBX-1]UIJ71607.1 DUF2937 family protein [Aurantimonas sp. HBX-1]